ncbi:MAG: hypothetical protein HQ472_04885 [Ignavibacteria bacterium]|nr:hypothetical protein [Ignavibacteria bacterium]
MAHTLLIVVNASTAPAAEQGAVVLGGEYGTWQYIILTGYHTPSIHNESLMVVSDPPGGQAQRP